MRIKSELVNGHVVVQTYYHNVFNRSAHDLGGKWNPNEKTWSFNVEYADIIRKKLKRIFGTTGEGDYQVCTLEIIDFNKEITLSPIYLFGRQIASAHNRDSGAWLGKDIIFLEGEYTSGGSRNYWTTVITNGKFHIRNFPVEAIKWKKVQDAINEGWCKVLLDKTEEQIIKEEINLLKERMESLQNELLTK